MGMTTWPLFEREKPSKREINTTGNPGDVLPAISRCVWFNLLVASSLFPSPSPRFFLSFKLGLLFSRASPPLGYLFIRDSVSCPGPW